MREYLIDDHVVLDCGNDRGRPDLALPPQSRHLSISMPGAAPPTRPGLRGPDENSLESLCPGHGQR